MFKAPTQTPPVSTLLDDLPTRDGRKIARHLGVTENTLKRWAKTGNAPRLAHLALFWESRWGLSVLDCDIWNRDTLRLGMIRYGESHTLERCPISFPAGSPTYRTCQQ